MKKNELTREEIENWLKRKKSNRRKNEILKNGVYTIIKEVYDEGYISGTEQVIRDLLAEGASIGKDSNDIDTLDYICDQLQKECIELLVDSYLTNNISNIDRYLLHRAAAQDSYHYIKVLLERGYDANLVDGNNRTPLHIAAAEDGNEDGNEDVVITLIQNGKSNINAQDT